MTITFPLWNGPICIACGRGHFQQPSYSTTTLTYSYQPRHRKPGPAQ